MSTPLGNDGSDALRVTDLRVRYGSLQALDGVSWTVGSGEILGIIGPNGAGKSSSFAAVTNTIKRTGQVDLFGESTDRLPTQVLARRGLRRTFQQNSFYGGMTVLDNAAAGFVMDSGVGLLGSLLTPWRELAQRRSSHAAAARLLVELGIDRRYHHMYPDDIPYGLQRCLSIVLAFGAGARVVLVDEPAAGVGGADMVTLADLLREFRSRGIALVLIEHHMDLVMEIVDRLLVIDRGRPIAYGSPEIVQRDPVVREAYLGRAA